MQHRSLTHAVHFGQVAEQYQHLRQANPHVRALTIKRYIDDAPCLTLQQFRCETEIGHEFAYTGSAYGGDSDDFGGEGRCYCINCGADGDA